MKNDTLSISTKRFVKDMDFCLLLKIWVEVLVKRSVKT